MKIATPVYLDVSATSVYLCSTSTSGYYSAINSYCAGISYGDAVFYSRVGQEPTKGFKFIRIKKNGQNCVYQSSDYIPTSTMFGSGCLQIADSRFLLARPFSGAPYEVTLPNFFINGGQFVLQPSFENIPSPCNKGTLANNFYCVRQNISAYEFDYTPGADTQVFASLYSQGYGGSTFLNGGFICDVNQAGSNLFNRVQLSYPSNVNAGNGINGPDVYNGLCFQRGSYFYCAPVSGVPNALGYAELMCENGDVLDCSTNQKNNTFVYATNQNELNTTLDNRFAAILSSGVGGSYCEIDGIFVRACNFLDSNQILTGFGIIVFNAEKIFVIRVATTAYNGITNAVLFADGTIIFGDHLYNATHMDFYKTSIDLASIGVYPSAVVKEKSEVPLLNDARPISTIGAYKA